VERIVSDDFYHDDPIEVEPNVKFQRKFLTSAVVIFASVLFFQSTLAGNISLSSGAGIEFGQGVSQTVACSGETLLTMTPNSSFTNAAGASGTHYLKSITVSDIPSTCDGVDFTISAYGNSGSSPLSIFNTSTKSAVVYSNAGNFQIGVGGSGASVASNSGTFTITFTTPVAASSTVYKITMQSGTHSLLCFQGGSCAVGDVGPGGGNIFYAVASPGFTCGPTQSGSCRYLEVAPPALGLASFDNVSSATRTWAQSSNQAISVSDIADFAAASAIGRGYYNTLAIISQGNSDSSTSAAALAQSFRGGGKNDWYLPSKLELKTMCDWVINTTCFSNTRPLNVGIGAQGFVGTLFYWSSTEYDEDSVWTAQFAQGGVQETRTSLKNGSGYIRPIRAF
jgi:hypothetical protein